MKIARTFLFHFIASWGMIEKIHEHIIEELKTNTKTDTIFILAAIALNFIGLGINMVFSGTQDPAEIIVFGVVGILIVIINLISIIGLSKGKKTREKLLVGLLKMYSDERVDGYYDKSILENYNTRYDLFTFVVVTTGVVALLVPIILFFSY